jgi:hypothetical protein
MDRQEETLIGLCPSCGKALKMERTGSKEEGEENLLHCEELCSNPKTMPTGARLMTDGARLLFTDGDMHEYTREEYIKNYGIDPLPIWRAMEKSRGMPTGETARH